jgi:hypothetical protein
MTIVHEHRHAVMLVRMAVAEGRIDPARILRRRADSPSRIAFLHAQRLGWVDAQGWVTRAGREAVRHR